MIIPSEEWDKLPPPVIMFCQTLSQEVLHTEPVTDKTKEAFLYNKCNVRVMHVVDTILAVAAESIIDKSWYLLKNQSTCNAFINGKYLPNIINAPDRQYICVHCNAGGTYTNRIGDLPGYSNPVWYNPKGIANNMSLWLLHKHHLVTYNSQDGNKFVAHIPQCPTFKMTKDGIFYQNMRHFLKNNNAYIMVNESRSPRPQVKKKNKLYTSHDVKRADSRKVIPEHHRPTKKENTARS